MRAAVWMVTLVILVALASCKSKRSLRELTLGLSWIHQAQFSGPYYADRNGLYAKEGLRVDFVPATVERDPLDEFIAGKYDFVIAQPDTLIKARAEGHRVKAVAVIYRIHPLVFLALESSGIETPQDFRGKTLGIAYSEKLILGALLRSLNIDPGEVNTVNRPYDFDSLQRGDIDAQAGWMTNELQTAREAGMKLNVISPYDYGITFYADVLTARESLIEQDPELVQRFVRATLRGWTEALQSPEEHARLSLHYNPELDLAHEAQVLKATGPLIHTGESPIGWMRAKEWEAMVRALHEDGGISQRPEVADLFTTRFIEADQQRQ